MCTKIKADQRLCKLHMCTCFHTSHRKKEAVQLGQTEKKKKIRALCVLVGERGDEGHGGVAFVLTFQLKDKLMAETQMLMTLSDTSQQRQMDKTSRLCRTGQQVVQII